MDEVEVQKQVQRAKMWNTIIFSLIAVIVIAVLIGFGIYRYQHTFTAKNGSMHQTPEQK